jgi:hypothetical protein
MNPLRIVIGQRGWVWIGRYQQEGDEVTLTDARCIRHWGTTKGLGELVEGPTKSTVLDQVGTVRLHRLGIVATYDVNEDAWK